MWVEIFTTFKDIAVRILVRTKKLRCKGIGNKHWSHIKMS